MQIPPTGLGPPDAAGPSRLGSIQGPLSRGPMATPYAGVTVDNVTTLLELLATPAIGTLVTGIDQLLVKGDQIATERILQAAVTAVVEGNYPGATAKVKELLAMNPELAESVAANPGLRPVHDEVTTLVSELKMVARAEATDKMASAHHAVADMDQRPSLDVDPRTLLVLSTFFFNTERLIGYKRSAELARRAVDLRGSAIGKDEAPIDMVERLRMLWSRAPLLVILAGWFALGWLAGYRVWALGFLALVLFQFYAHVRKIKL